MTLERILLMGGQWTGKTTAAASFAEFAHRLAFPCAFHVFDTDGCWPLQLAPGVPAHVHHCVSWEDFEDAGKTVVREARPGDWIVLDRADDPWQAVQNYYVWETYDASPGMFFSAWKKKEVAARKDGRGNPFLADYQRGINPLWFDWWHGLLALKCHVLVCTGAAEIVTDQSRRGFSDSPDTRNMNPLGLRPQGQKDLGKKMHTVHCLEKAGRTYQITTHRERWAERGWFDHEPLTNWAAQYFLGKARLVPRRGEGFAEAHRGDG